ncbi:MAG TPA: hypothetical protein VFV47_01660 [Hyphomicrobiaceae bacterium]|nr:hypothetical protein [Hyphomicrobiaceae bacterium]
MRHLQIASKMTAAALVATLLVPVSMLAQANDEKIAIERSVIGQVTAKRTPTLQAPDTSVGTPENW